MLPCWSRSLPQSDARGWHRPWGAPRRSAAGRHRWLLRRRARRLTRVCVATRLCPGSAARAAFVLASLSSCCAMLSCPLRPRERPTTYRHAQTHRHTFSCSSSASPGAALQALRLQSAGLPFPPGGEPGALGVLAAAREGRGSGGGRGVGRGPGDAGLTAGAGQAAAWRGATSTPLPCAAGAGPGAEMPGVPGRAVAPPQPCCCRRRGPLGHWPHQDIAVHREALAWPWGLCHPGRAGSSGQAEA